MRRFAGVLLVCVILTGCAYSWEFYAEDGIRSVKVTPNMKYIGVLTEEGDEYYLKNWLFVLNDRGEIVLQYSAKTNAILDFAFGEDSNNVVVSFYGEQGGEARFGGPDDGDQNIEEGRDVEVDEEAEEDTEYENVIYGNVVIDTAGREITRGLDIEGFSPLTMTPDGRYLFCGNGMPEIFIPLVLYDMTRNRRVLATDAEDGYLTPDGKRMLTVEGRTSATGDYENYAEAVGDRNEDSAVNIEENLPDTSALPLALKCYAIEDIGARLIWEKKDLGYTLPFGAMSSSYDGKRIAVVDSVESEIKLLDANGNVTGRFKPECAKIDPMIMPYFVKMSGDGSCVLSFENGISGNFLYFIDGDSGELKWEHIEKDYEVSSCDISKDGNYAVASLVMDEDTETRKQIKIFGRDGTTLKKIEWKTETEETAIPPEVFISESGEKIIYLKDINTVACLEKSEISSPSCAGDSGDAVMYEARTKGRRFLISPDYVSTIGKTLVMYDSNLDFISGRWNKDRTAITCVSNIRGNWDVFLKTFTVTDSGMSHTDNFFTEPGDETSPEISPDGSKILYGSDKTGKWHVFERELVTGKIRRLTSGESNNINARYSPDGRRIAYSSDRNGNWDVFTQLLDAPDTVIQVTAGKSDELYPCWSPSGDSIAYCSNASGERKIYVTKSDGAGSPVLLTKERGNQRMPDWSRDGKRIVYVSDSRYFDEIFSRNAEGSGEPALLVPAEQ